MEINNIIDKTKGYILDLISKISETNPLINFTKPLLNRLVENNINKIDKALAFFKDKDGNINTDDILSDIIKLMDETKPFNVLTLFLGDIKIGDGKIVLNIPFTDKNIIFNKSDLEDLKTILKD